MLQGELIGIARRLDLVLQLLEKLLDRGDEPASHGRIRVTRIGPYETKDGTMANQDPGVVNTLTSDQHVIVEFETDTTRGIDVAPDGVPVLTVDNPALAAAILVPAPTEGPGRFAFDFVPVDGAVGACVVTITADGKQGAEVKTITRAVMFDILPLEADLINVSVNDPLSKAVAPPAAPPVEAAPTEAAPAA